MTTARIRGVEKVCVTDLTDAGPVFYRVADGMTFANLIAEVCKKDRVSLDLLNNWYLVDAGRGECCILISTLAVYLHRANGV